MKAWSGVVVYSRALVPPRKKFSNIENVKKFEKNSNIDQEEITFIAQIRPYQPCVRARE